MMNVFVSYHIGDMNPNVNVTVLKYCQCDSFKILVQHYTLFCDTTNVLASKVNYSNKPRISYIRGLCNTILSQQFHITHLCLIYFHLISCYLPFFSGKIKILALYPLRHTIDGGILNGVIQEDEQLVHSKGVVFFGHESELFATFAHSTGIHIPVFITVRCHYLIWNPRI